MPARSQITLHNCVEGWSAIGQWKGVPLGDILKLVALKPEARYIVFHCADDFGGTLYYESVDLDDAFHPQTILAYDMNGGPLPIGHGAPIRMRIERQLGYKHAKFVMRIEAVRIAGGSRRRQGRVLGGYDELLLVRRHLAARPPVNRRSVRSSHPSRRPMVARAVEVAGFRTGGYHGDSVP